MSNRLGGKTGTAYIGTNANQPPNYIFDNRNPTQYDTQNVSLGDLWLNTSNENLYYLASLAGNSTSKGVLANWVLLSAGGIGTVQTLTGNSGGAVPPLNGNINVVGDATGINIVGNPATNTLTVSLVGGGIAAQSFPTDSGTATPNSSGVLNIKSGLSTLNSGVSVYFSGASNTVTLNLTDVNHNTILGNISGISGITGVQNSSVGYACFTALTTGQLNFAGGANSLQLLTTGSNNTACGQGGLTSITTGSNNIGIGRNAGINYSSSEASNIVIGNIGTTGESNVIKIGTYASAPGAGQQNKCFIAACYANNGTNNTFVGEKAGNSAVSGSTLTAVGFNAGNAWTSATQSVAVGANALLTATSGSNNIAIGPNSLQLITTGAQNVCVGQGTGSGYTSTESNNIIIGHNIAGTLGESNIIRIGNSSNTKCFVNGSVQASTNLYTAGDDGAGAASTTSITNVTNTSLSTGTLSVKSTTGNNGNNAGFIKIYVGTTVAYIPYFTNIAP